MIQFDNYGDKRFYSAKKGKKFKIPFYIFIFYIII